MKDFEKKSSHIRHGAKVFPARDLSVILKRRSESVKEN